jgi:peptidoglycan/LPS O-acetylase OafA/YrhL
MDAQKIETPRFLHALTAARAVAAFGVIAFHYGQGCSRSISELAYRLAGAGFIGVPFFFILSGYLLSYSASRTAGPSRSAAQFYAARFARIYPVYFLSFLLGVSLDLWRTGLASLTTEKLTGYAMYLFGIQSWSISHAFILNGPAWSLSVEFFFYLLFPVLHALSVRQQIAGLLSYASAGAILVTVLLLGQGGSGELKHLISWTHPLLWLPLFWSGLLVSELSRRLASLGFSDSSVAYYGLSLATATALIAIPASGWFRTSTIGFCYIMAVPCTAAILLLAHSKRLQRPASHKVVILLGFASYAMYLLHRLLADFASTTATLSPSMGCGIYLPYLGAVVVVSILVYLGVEGPARRFLTARPGLNRAWDHGGHAQSSPKAVHPMESSL